MGKRTLPLFVLPLLLAAAVLIYAMPGRPGRLLASTDHSRFQAPRSRASSAAHPGVSRNMAQRLARARRLVARFDRLDQDQKESLVQLGDAAYQALLPLAQRRLNTANPFDFELVLLIIQRVMTPPRTPQLLALLQRAKSPDYSAPILRALAEHGDERLTVPLFLRILKKARKATDYIEDPAGAALDGLARSSRPDAVQYLIGELADPRADPYIRYVAYVNLARTGGPAGLRAVLAARDTIRTLPPLSELMGLDRLGVIPSREGYGPPALRAVHKDANGILWGLVASPVLGSYDDLWIVRRKGSHWIDPLFTGVDISQSNFYHRAPARILGMTRDQLLNGGWVHAFLGNPALRRDSDHDGWTDLEEQRLGTDPHRPDTDGDGIVDSRDQNPLAAAQPSSDVQKILAAAFEARFRAERRGVPCVITMPAGVPPFEFRGWDGIILEQTKDRSLPADKLYGEGVGKIGFTPPYFDFARHRVNPQDSTPPILWNKQHSQARLGLRANYGGQNGTVYDIQLKKFGSDWVVTSAVMTMIS